MGRAPFPGRGRPSDGDEVADNLECHCLDGALVLWLARLIGVSHDTIALQQNSSPVVLPELGGPDEIAQDIAGPPAQRHRRRGG